MRGMMRLAVLSCLSLMGAGMAQADTVEELVHEAALATLGDTFPEGAVVSVRFKGTAPEAAAFLSEFRMNPATGQFAARAISEDGTDTVVTGLAAITVPVPVPARNLKPDEIITEADIRIVSLPVQRVNAYAVTKKDELVGRQVRHMLTPGRPVMEQAVMMPIVIHRGDEVTITYRDGDLSLSVPGRAMGDAHQDQPVKVVNLSSNLLVEGTAVSEGNVEVTR